MQDAPLAPPNITSITFNLNNMPTHASKLAAELAALTHLQRLHICCPFFINDNTSLPDSQLIPLASTLSSFLLLTNLKFQHRPRHHCTNYVTHLTDALLLLSKVQQLCIDIDMHGEDECDTAALGDAFSALNRLTSLTIPSPTTSMISQLTPHLPGDSLLHLELEMPVYCKFNRRALCLQGTSPGQRIRNHPIRTPPYLRAFTPNATHLTTLQSLTLRTRFGARDIAELASLLSQNLNNLTAVQFTLIGKPTEDPNVPACSEEDAVALCESFRELSLLRKLELELDFWFDRLPEVLFQPTDSSVSVDRCWMRLNEFSVRVAAPQSPATTPMHGDVPLASDGTFQHLDMLCQAVAACESLETVRLNVVTFTAESLNLLRIRTYSFICLKSLNFSANMPVKMGRGVGQMLAQLTNLESLMLKPVWAEEEFYFLNSGYILSPQGGSFECSVDLLRNVVIGMSMSSIGLPCLQHLLLDCKFRLSSPVLRKIPDEEAVANAKEFGGALAVVLQHSARLQTLSIISLDLLPDCIQLLAPRIHEAPGLTQLSLKCGKLNNVASYALLQHAKNHAALADVSLEHFGIYDSSNQMLCAWLESLPELQKLSFECSEFGMMGDVFQQDMGRLPNVGKVNFHGYGGSSYYSDNRGFGVQTKRPRVLGL